MASFYLLVAGHISAGVSDEQRRVVLSKSLFGRRRVEGLIVRPFHITPDENMTEGGGAGFEV
jgi:hypothetical protein